MIPGTKMSGALISLAGLGPFARMLMMQQSVQGYLGFVKGSFQER